MSTLRCFHWMWQLLVAISTLSTLGGCFPSVRNTKVPFPETIWLDGLVPYKLDKSFKINVEELLDQRARMRPIEFLQKLRRVHEFEENNDELKTELQSLFANIPNASSESLENIETKSNGEEIVNEISIALEPSVNSTEEVILYADEIPLNGSTVIANNNTAEELIEHLDEQSMKNVTDLSEEMDPSLDDNSVGKNIIVDDQTEREIKSYVLIWDISINSTDDLSNDKEINRTLQLETNDKASINSSQITSTNISEIVDSSFVEGITKSSEQSGACSLIEELLDTPGGNASIFERTLLEVSTQWQPWQKAHIVQLTRQVHHIMTLIGVDLSHKIEAIQRLTALDLWRNRIVKRMLLPYWIPNFGSLQKFFICLWQK